MERPFVAVHRFDEPRKPDADAWTAPSERSEQKWGLMIAACLISMLPPLILYLFAQKYFLKGISVSEGVKG